MNIFLADEQDEPLSTEPLRRLAELVLTEESLDDDTEVTLLFVDDDVIADYNKRFMGRAGPTDVLAFPLEPATPGTPPKRMQGGPPVNLGDVVIAPAYVTRAAAERGVDTQNEMGLMVVHGILHLLGWDHQNDDQAEEMERREADLLKRVGLRRS